ncbi:MAG TPA: acetate--CoA ligase [Candidatus Methanoperedenaceae archaeon]|nr:acetate--CoA ligase [Candidatus Methanoperedenaceae archaeon]
MSEKTITSVMEETREFEPPAEFSAKAHIKSLAEYEEIYKKSIADPDAFWAEKAEENLEWFKKWDTVFTWDPAEAKHTWFAGGKLNVSYNCLDKHLKTEKKNKAAIIFEGEHGDSRTYTYQQLHYEVCKLANVLKSKGIKKGDRVSIYLPMIPELPISMLACARIGAIHSIVFGGFSSDALRDRILDSECKLLITSDGSFRSGKIIPLKTNADEAVSQCDCIKNVVVVKRAGNDINMIKGRDEWFHELMEDASPACDAEEMDAEDPLFILYTSGSTGKPKGVLHTTAGYLLYTTQTFKWIFDYKDEDTFWCTADIGWVTGHSYIVYAPLNSGATSLMFEGVPNYPKPDRFWEIVEKYKVNIIYTAPTAIRAMMKDGDKWPLGRDLSSLRLLGTVGEPINPEAWMWYYEIIGKSKCPIVDTWWQTETGGILIAPIPGAIPIKPGSATKPFPGIEPVILREDGTEADVNEGGNLVIKKPWPGLMRTVYGHHQRFKDTYFSQFPGVYTTGDGARIDENGYIWLMGRVDDVINVSGHRMGTAEVESALVAHETVAESAVVGFPHDIKGEGIYAFVTLKSGETPSDDLKNELATHVRKEIGPIAKPDAIQFTDGLPKTRSGKIMRRILKKIAAGDIENLGDTSTLADPSVVDSLVEGRQK